MNMKCTTMVLSVLVALGIAAEAFGACAEPFGGPCPTKPVVFLSGFDGNGRAWKLTPGLQAKLKSVGELDDVDAYLVIGPSSFDPAGAGRTFTFCGLDSDTNDWKLVILSDEGRLTIRGVWRGGEMVPDSDIAEAVFCNLLSRSFELDQCEAQLAKFKFKSKKRSKDRENVKAKLKMNYQVDIGGKKPVKALLKFKGRIRTDGGGFCPE